MPPLLCHDSFFIHFKFVLDPILFLDISRDTWVPRERQQEKAKANKQVRISLWFTCNLSNQWEMKVVWGKKWKHCLYNSYTVFRNLSNYYPSLICTSFRSRNHTLTPKEIPNISIEASHMLFKMFAKEEEIIEHFGFFPCLAFPTLVYRKC